MRHRRRSHFGATAMCAGVAASAMTAVAVGPRDLTPPAAARRAVISFAATWRRHTDTTSRSTSSRRGQCFVRQAIPERVVRPFPSSPNATANTLASTTITFCPDVTHRCAERHLPTLACPGALENLFDSRLTRVGNQTAPEVFLQGLMRACGALAEHSVSFLGNIFDLHARHGASMAPAAPQRKSGPLNDCTPGSCQ